MEEFSQPHKLKTIRRNSTFAESLKQEGTVTINKGEANEERVGEPSPNAGLFKTFFNDCSAPCFVKDDQGCYVFINDEFERQFGVKRHNFIGTTAAPWVGEEVARKMRTRDLEVLSEHLTTSEREVLPNADGVLRNWIVHRFPIFDSRRRCFLGGIAFDVTIEKQKEDQMREKSELLELILNNIGDPVIAVD